jgi:DNA-binding response OmpR family regulator
MLRTSLLLTMTEKAGAVGLSKEFSQAGYQVHLAHTAHEAIVSFERVTIDIVLLHTDLPDTHVSQLCQHVRRYTLWVRPKKVARLSGLEGVVKQAPTVAK